MRLMFHRVVFALAASVLAAGTLPAQDAEPGPFARIVVLAPKPGRAADFEAGYQRHLAWHRSHRDPWTWYGWTFVLGDRLGQFMDGTFGHAAADFDNAVDPAGDGADNVANVSPVADFLSHGMYERLVESSRGAPLPDTTTYMVMTTYRVVPGRAGEFEQLLGARAKAPARGADPRYSWYRLRVGGDTPQYLLLRAAPTWEAAAGLPEPFAGSAGAMLKQVTVELLRYRPTLSYRP
jgi:hypothetical protein